VKKIARDRWLSSDASQALLQTLHRMNDGTPAPHLQHDYPQSGLRTLFRMSMAPTREQSSRFDPAVNPLCPRLGCHNALHNVFHVIMICHAAAAARAELFDQCALRGFRPGYLAILGSSSGVPSSHRRWFGGASLKFLRLVYQSLNVP